MTDALKHRGPNAEGFWSHGPVAFGHRRLSIIDLDRRSDQPMSDSSGRYHLIFNGEIYNFHPLRTQLQRDGFSFRTESDTEVLLNAYIRWGAKCVDHLNGMFAFAIWDQSERKLTVARDRLGEKPLYFRRLANGIAFASELKALRLHPETPGGIDARALGQYLSLNYTLGNRCFVPGAEKLEPGHILTYSRADGIQIRNYWDLAQAFRNKRTPCGQAADEEALRRSLEEAVSLRMLSDVPLGAFLSGGIDSASIVHAMKGTSRTRTFSIGFSERTYSELPQARKSAAHLHTEHYEKMAHWDLADALPRIVRCADEPFGDNSIIPTYFLSQFAREKVTVSLSGDGGDEIFAGYETYKADRLHRRFQTMLTGRFARPMRAVAELAARSLPVSFNKVGLDDKIRRFTAGLALSPEDAHYSWRTIFNEAEKQDLLRPDVFAATQGESGIDEFQRHFNDVEDCDFLDRAMYVDIKTWLPYDILHKVDRASMAHSLEVRAPFLDHKLVEFAAALPPSLKLHGATSKFLLRRSQRRNLPPSVVKGRKRGFNAPMAHWLVNDLKSMTEDILYGSALGAYVRPEAVQTLWQDHKAGRRDNSYKIFGLLCLGLWLEQPIGTVQ